MKRPSCTQDLFIASARYNQKLGDLCEEDSALPFLVFVLLVTRDWFLLPWRENNDGVVDCEDYDEDEDEEENRSGELCKQLSYNLAYMTGFEAKRSSQES